MNDLFNKLQKVSYVPPIDVCGEQTNLQSTEPCQILLSDPNISQTKGRKKNVKGKATSVHSGRLKSGIEIALKKKKRMCHMCKQFGHDKRTCPSNPKSKTNKVALDAEAEYSDSDQEANDSDEEWEDDLAI
ncbi:hypothetical protein Vadar_030291 [Vaccinium darrowii]|uniref:Uncharacterized protein n=1 Tax=Vaccinium darrowii TaxID=229202 RepID=A0ACB7YIA7_9ERIC|nr:hypothetical protein Vadar_030291 [Vaccinium darrowii]